LHFEVIAGRFGKWRKAEVEARVAHYRSLGLDAKISTDVPGPFLKISFGTYFTLHEDRFCKIGIDKVGQNRL